jgi:hypothetical protein
MMEEYPPQQRKLMRTLLIFVSFVIFVVNLHSATYYIDFGSGSDANNGTSKSTPWQRHPDMQGFAGTYTHHDGDQFIFKGGVSWTITCFPWDISHSSATAGSPDYYGVDKTWYAGSSWTRPDFNAGYNGHSLLYFNTLSNITVDSFDMHSVEENSAGVWGVINDQFSEYLTITNCHIHDWLFVTNNGPNQDGFHGGFAGNYSAPTGITNVILTGCEIENLVNGNNGPSGASQWSGICVFGASLVTNCLVHDNGNLIDGVFQVKNNYVYDQGYPFTNFDNQFHLDMILAYDNTGVNPGQTAVVSGNYVWNGGHGQGAGLIYVPTGNNDAYIYDNVLFGSFPTYPIFGDANKDEETTPTSSLYIYNNTVISPNANSSLLEITARYVGGGGSGTPIQFAKLYITNNFYSGPSSQQIAQFNGSSIGAWAVVYGTNSNLILPNNGYETYGYQSNSPTLIYNPPSAASPTVGAGTNLTSLGLFHSDILGNALPSSGAWDIGAYQFSGGSPPTNTTTNVISYLNATTTIQYNAKSAIITITPH